MKVSINKNTLETVLINVQPYLEKKDLSQITSHIFLSSSSNGLEIKATDFEIGLTYSTKNIKNIDEGKATANGKKMLDIVKNLKDEDITLESINEYLYIKQKNSKYKLPMFNHNEFPDFPDTENKSKFDINSSNLVRYVKKISPAIDSNNPKYELNGALIDIKKESISLVSTDTKRLALCNIENKSDTDFSIIIPKKAIQEMQKLFYDDIEIFYDNNVMIAKTEFFTFFTKLINGKFPDYQRVIPSEKRIELKLSRDKIIESMKQINMISNEMKITFKADKIVFESLNEDNIEAKTEIEFDTGLDEEIFVSVNSKHILDFLSNIESPDFSLGFNDSSLPFILESENFKTVIMPIIF